MFFSRSKKTDARLLLDVDSHSIRALIFEVSSADNLPKVIRKMAVRLRLASGGKRTAEKMHEFILATLKFLGRVPSEILVSMGPSIAEYNKETWRIPFDSLPKHFSPADIQKQFYESAAERRNSGVIAGAELAGIEANGYFADLAAIADTPLVSLSFRVFTVALPAEVRSAFLRAEQMLGGVPLKFVPSPLVFAESASVLQKSGQAMLVVEINDAETMLMAVKEGTLAGFSVFPLGAASFARRVGERRGFLYQDAKDTIRQMSYGIQLAVEAQKIEEDMAAVCEAWKRKFGETMDSLYCYGPFSGEILLAGEGSYILPVRSFLGSAEWLEGVSYAANPSLRILDAAAFFEGNTFDGVLQGPEDAELGALMHYSLFHKSLLPYNGGNTMRHNM